MVDTDVWSDPLRKRLRFLRQKLAGALILLTVDQLHVFGQFSPADPIAPDARLDADEHVDGEQRHVRSRDGIIIM